MACADTHPLPEANVREKMHSHTDVDISQDELWNTQRNTIHWRCPPRPSLPPGWPRACPTPPQPSDVDEGSPKTSIRPSRRLAGANIRAAGAAACNPAEAVIASASHRCECRLLQLLEAFRHCATQSQLSVKINQAPQRLVCLHQVACGRTRRNPRGELRGQLVVLRRVSADLIPATTSKQSHQHSAHQPQAISHWARSIHRKQQLLAERWANIGPPATS